MTTTSKTEQTPPRLQTVFSTAGKKTVDPVVQDRVDRECQHPITPYKITDEDWKYGIGLN